MTSPEIGVVSNFTLDRTAGSHTLAAAGQRGREVQSPDTGRSRV